MEAQAQLLEIAIGILAGISGHLAEVNAHLGAIAECLINESDDYEDEDEEEEEEEVPEDAQFICASCLGVSAAGVCG